MQELEGLKVKEFSLVEEEFIAIKKENDELKDILSVTKMDLQVRKEVRLG